MVPPVVRVSVVRCSPDKFALIRRLMVDADPILRPGIEAMNGLLDFYAGADEATSSLTNVSIWTDLTAAKQLDKFEPMLELGRKFTEAGATFERPVMNYATLWQLAPASKE
jgi:hypothetical protein